jgi:hypothetical protein
MSAMSKWPMASTACIIFRIISDLPPVRVRAGQYRSSRIGPGVGASRYWRGGTTRVSPSAFAAGIAWQRRGRGDQNYDRITAGTATFCRRYSEACRRLVPYTFLAATLGGRQRAISPSGENGDYRERREPDFPTGLSFSTARRERSDDLSHIKKTLNPGVPVHPRHSIFRCLRAAACLQRGRLACRGSTNTMATACIFPPPTCDYNPAQPDLSIARGEKGQCNLLVASKFHFPAWTAAARALPQAWPPETARRPS